MCFWSLIQYFAGSGTENTLPPTYTHTFIYTHAHTLVIQRRVLRSIKLHTLVSVLI